MTIAIVGATMTVRLARGEVVDLEALRIALVPLARNRGVIAIRVMNPRGAGSAFEPLALWLGQAATERV